MNTSSNPIPTGFINDVAFSINETKRVVDRVSMEWANPHLKVAAGIEPMIPKISTGNHVKISIFQTPQFAEDDTAYPLPLPEISTS